MKREYLFKGKRIDDEKWTEGHGMSYYKGLDTAVIIHKQGINTMHHTEVIPSTVCQFTGLTDKNGVKIFDGDILFQPDVDISEFYNGNSDKCIVVYNERLSRFLLEFESIYGGEGYSGTSEHDQLHIYVRDGFVVIGTIHDVKEQTVNEAT